jgi:hypothetical protein
MRNLSNAASASRDELLVKINAAEGLDSSRRFFVDARREVVEAKTTDQVKGILARAAGLAAAARTALNREVEADAKVLKLEAERKLGQLMRAQEETVGLNKGGGDKRSDHRDSKKPSDPPTLAEAAINKNLAHRARTAAAMSEAEFEGAKQAERAAALTRTRRLPRTRRPSIKIKRRRHSAAPPAQPAESATPPDDDPAASAEKRMAEMAKLDEAKTIEEEKTDATEEKVAVTEEKVAAASAEGDPKASAEDDPKTSCKIVVVSPAMLDSLGPARAGSDKALGQGFRKSVWGMREIFAESERTRLLVDVSSLDDLEVVIAFLQRVVGELKKKAMPSNLQK